MACCLTLEIQVQFSWDLLRLYHPLPLSPNIGIVQVLICTFGIAVTNLRKFWHEWDYSLGINLRRKKGLKKNSWRDSLSCCFPPYPTKKDSFIYYMRPSSFIYMLQELINISLLIEWLYGGPDLLFKPVLETISFGYVC